MRSALLLALTLLFVVTGCGASTGSGDAARSSESTVPTSTVPASTSASAKGGPFGAMSIVRTGNGFTLTGEVPDESLKTGLPDTLRQALPGAKIVDDLTVKPGVTGPEFSGLGALFGAAMDVPGFAVKLAGDTATLTGSAEADAAKSAAETAVTQTWPNVKVVNDIRVGSGGCGATQGGLAAATKSPITFATNEFGLTPDARQRVAAIADAGRACRGLTLTVVGYTDDTGGDAVNVPLSVNRAKAVADALVADGIPAAEVTSRGAGAANPVAGNDTVAGRAENRRVEVSVG